ncbi:MAG: thiamine-phosphate kinase [Limisphaerales bacterium]
MNEFELIRALTRGLPPHPAVVAGPGDDCAVLDLGVPGRVILFKTDAVVEGVHFFRDAAPEKVGHKALGRVLSDLAAMAGTPVAALVTLALPAGFNPAWPQAVYAGLRALADRTGTAVAGGETTTSPAPHAWLSVAALGTAAADRRLGRGGSKPGDALFVTGELGGSILGRHLDFEPRLVEGRWLAEQFPVTAMMDVSDGLAGDLGHLLEASRAGAELLRDAIPVSRAAKLRAREVAGAPPALEAALRDGEDFELLFTVPAARAVPLQDAWRRQFPGVRLSCIGRITEQPGLRLLSRDAIRALSPHAYAHFAQPVGD